MGLHRGGPLEHGRDLAAVRPQVDDDKNVIMTTVEIVIQGQFYSPGDHVSLSSLDSRYNQ